MALEVDANTMTSLGSRRSDSVSVGVGGKTAMLVYGFVIFTALVFVVTSVAVADGAIAALMAGLVIVAGVGMTVGLWGAAMAVKDTDELGWQRPRGREGVAWLRALLRTR